MSRAGVIANLVFLIYASTALAAFAQAGGRTGEPFHLAAQDERKPLVKRPQPHVCYDPPQRVACKQRCDVGRAQCASDLTACDEQAAKCASTCPPKVCSRGASPR